MKSLLFSLVYTLSALAILLSAVPIKPALAMTDEQRNLFNHAVKYYDIDGACADSSGGSDGGGDNGSTGGGGGGHKYTLEEVMKFASSPYGATWNISDSKVESWFLSSGTHAISKYGINSGNIGQLTSTVKSLGVSPVFFYLYTVNEGAGYGGFINHFQTDTGQGMIADARRDAQYIVSQSKDMQATPATQGGEPDSMPTAEAKQFMSKLPSGSIGRIYLSATSAVTAEVEELYGKFDVSSTRYGRPLQDSMDRIKAMGGDPTVAGSTIDPGSSDTSDCSSDSDGTSASANQDLIAEWAKYFAKWGTEKGNGVHYSQGSDNCTHATAGDANKLKDCIQAGHNPPFHGAIDCSGFQIAVVFMATGNAPGNLIAGPGGYGSGNGELIGAGSNFKKINWDEAKAGDFWVAIGTTNHIETVTGPASGGKTPTIDETGNAHSKSQGSGQMWRYVGPWPDAKKPPAN